MQCDNCVRPRNLGSLCATGANESDEPCHQKITLEELNQAEFGEICAWCGGSCCFCGVMCRYFISNETLIAYGISTELKVPCAGLNQENGCLLPRECRPKPCLIYVCEMASALIANQEM